MNNSKAVLIYLHLNTVIKVSINTKSNYHTEIKNNCDDPLGVPKRGVAFVKDHVRALYFYGMARNIAISDHCFSLVCIRVRPKAVDVFFMVNKIRKKLCINVTRIIFSILMSRVISIIKVIQKHFFLICKYWLYVRADSKAIKTLRY